MIFILATVKSNVAEAGLSSFLDKFEMMTGYNGSYK
jgi:hypothetical protein